MASPLTRMQKNALAPALVVAISFLLVSGQVFNCCRLQEGLAEILVNTLEALHGKPGSSPASVRAEARAETAPSHAGCHGHGPVGADEEASISEVSGAYWKFSENCLADKAFSS